MHPLQWLMIGICFLTLVVLLVAFLVTKNTEVDLIFVVEISLFSIASALSFSQTWISYHRRKRKSEKTEAQPKETFTREDILQLRSLGKLNLLAAAVFLVIASLIGCCVYSTQDYTWFPMTMLFSVILIDLYFWYQAVTDLWNYRVGKIDLANQDKNDS